MTTMKLVPLVFLVLLAGCDRQKKEFVASCTNDELSEAECACIYTLAEEELSPRDREAFVTSVIEEGNVAGMLAGGDFGQSLVSGISLLGFMVKVQGQCIAAS